MDEVHAMSEAAGRRRKRNGILPSQDVRRLVADGTIAADAPVAEAQIQPASLDLRLGRYAHRVRASFLPGPGASVAEKIEAFAMHRIDLGDGAVLERGCVYVVELMERVRLPADLTGLANPKSSSGRLDVFTRLICDRAAEFDRVEAGYEGRLYAEIAPRTFSVLVRQGSRLNQLRLRQGRETHSDAALERLHRESPLVHGAGGPHAIAGGIAVSIDLEGSIGAGGTVGWRARKHAALVDVERIAAYDALDFWEPLPARDRRLILDPDDFYILASREAVTVPPDHAAEMLPYNPLVGEFRVHYAGFFDPGFGHAGSGGGGSRAVLEIRSHEVPFLMEHGQIVARLVYEPLLATPDKLYGREVGSSYQGQGLKLGKQFRAG